MSGVRLNGVTDFHVRNVFIKNIVSLAPQGTDYCGEYADANDGGHFVQKLPWLRGYTGNKVHGMYFDNCQGIVENVGINELRSHTGSTHGISIWMNSQVLHLIFVFCFYLVGFVCICVIAYGFVFLKPFLLTVCHPRSCMLKTYLLTHIVL